MTPMVLSPFCLLSLPTAGNSTFFEGFFLLWIERWIPPSNWIICAHPCFRWMNPKFAHFSKGRAGFVYQGWWDSVNAKGTNWFYLKKPERAEWMFFFARCQKYLAWHLGNTQNFGTLRSPLGQQQRLKKNDKFDIFGRWVYKMQRFPHLHCFSFLCKGCQIVLYHTEACWKIMTSPTSISTLAHAGIGFASGASTHCKRVLPLAPRDALASWLPICFTIWRKNCLKTNKNPWNLVCNERMKVKMEMEKLKKYNCSSLLLFQGVL